MIEWIVILCSCYLEMKILEGSCELNFLKSQENKRKGRGEKGSESQSREKTWVYSAGATGNTFKISWVLMTLRKLWFCKNVFWVFLYYLQCLANLILFPLLIVPFCIQFFLSTSQEQRKSSHCIKEIQNCRKQGLDDKESSLPSSSRGFPTSNIKVYPQAMMLLSNPERFPNPC